MIHEFLETWPLFREAYLTGVLLAVSLSLTGIFLVAREQIFLGAAVAQASMLGVASCFTLGAWLSVDLEAWDLGFALLFSTAAAITTSAASSESGGRHEVLTGWIFLVGASGSYLLVHHSPRGTEEIQGLLFSTLIGAEPRDVWILAAATLVGLTGLLLARRPLLLAILGPRFAETVGISTRLWARSYSVWLGLLLGYSLVVSGLLFTFACLVLPALIARNLVKSLRPVFILTPTIAVIVTLGGFIVAHDADLPPGHVVTLGLAALFPLSAIVKRVRARR